MIWQMAIVRRDADGRPLLEFSDPAGCTRCRRGTGCGAALFSRLFVSAETRLPLGNEEPIRPEGRLVRVGLDPRWLLLAAASNYLLPVVMFVAGAVVADIGWPRSDSAALIGGLGSLFAAAFLARPLLRGVHKPKLRLVDLPDALESGSRCDHVSQQEN